MTVTPPAHASPPRVVELEIENGAGEPVAPADDSREAARRDAVQRSIPPQAEVAIEPCADTPLDLRIEALLMTTDRPITEARLGEVLGLSGKGVNKRVAEAIELLNQHYHGSNRSFRAQRLAGGWQLLTLPTYGPLLHRMHEQRELTRLSQPALETLAIVAYRQPIMRAEIEAIRGVASGEVLRSLMERRLIKIVGRAEELGRPMLYGTTIEFLKVFGMASMDDLPHVKGLNMPGTPERPISTVQTPEPSDQSAAGDAAVVS
jgi:segregation and condensation protein B